MTPIEQSLIAVLVELTDSRPEQISLTTSFDQQGVDSFIALRLMRAINDQFGVDLELELLFDYPNVQALAQLIDSRRADSMQNNNVN